MKTIARTLRMTLALLTALAPFHGIPASAQGVPARTHFQGRLTDASNNPLTGPNGFVFEIYDAASGGALLWTETQPAVAVANGVFAVELGAVTPLPSATFSGAAAYLQVTVNGNAMTPRERLVAVPYSHNTQLLAGREFAAFVSTDATAQNVAGAKTFTGTVFVPAPTLPGHAASKAYVDAAGGTGLLASTNTWSGQNSFLNLVSVSSDLVITGVLNRGTPLSLGGPLSVAAGVTAASGTFTASGPSQFSLQTSSGISVGGTGGVYANFFSGTFFGDGAGLTGLSGVDGTKVLKAGDTMTGQLTNTSTVTVLGNAFSVGGSTLAVTGGKVGIGTAGPTEALHIRGNAPSLKLEHTGGADVTLHTSDGSGLAGIHITEGTNKLSIQDAGDTIMARASGSVGIRTVDPAQALDVNGNAQFGAGAAKSTFTAAGALSLASGAALTLAGPAGNFTGASSVTASGFFGDGSGLTNLSASDASRVAKAGDTMTGQLTNTSTVTVQGNAFSVGGSTLVVSGGKVGLGTTTPASALHVKADGASLRQEGDKPVFLSHNSSALSTPNRRKVHIGWADDSRFAVEQRTDSEAGLTFRYLSFDLNNGNTGVGTSAVAPLATLHAEGNTPFIASSAGIELIRVTGSSVAFAGGAVVMRSTAATAGHAFLRLEDNAGIELLRAQQNGRIGLGTTAPGTKLDVEGNAQFGSGATKSTFTTVGALTLAYDAALTLSGASGNITTNSSMTASAFFGSGAGLTGVSGSDATKVAKSGDAMTGPLTVSGSSITIVDTNVGGAGDAFSLAVTTAPDRSVYHLVVSTTGNVGIGTAIPGQRLEVKGSLRVATDAASTNAGSQVLQFGTYVSGAYTPTAIIGDTSGADSALKIFALQGNMHLGSNTGGAASTRMVVNTSGGVTVGGSDLASTGSRLYVEGPSAVVVDNSGSVGVGTTSPGAKLDVEGAAQFGSGAAKSTFTAAGGLTFASGFVPAAAQDAATKGYVDGQATAASGWTQGGGLVRVTNPSNSVVVQSTLTVQGNAFSVGGSTLVVTGGNVGIGTTNPGATLEISKPSAILNVTATGNTATDHAYLGIANGADGAGNAWSYWRAGAGAQDVFSVGVDNADGKFKLTNWGNLSSNVRMTVDQSGNVGIGTTAPASKIHVLDGDIRVSTSAGQPSKGIVFQDGTIQTTAAGGTGGGWTDAGSVVQLATPTDTIGSTGAGVTVSTHLIVSAGNVGIGTTTPNERLTVVRADGESFTGLSGAAGNHTSLALGRTATEARLAIAAGAGSYTPSSVAGDAILRVDDAAKKLHLLAGIGSAVMTITAGNVGIGTAGPTYKLDVNGDAVVRSSLTYAGALTADPPATAGQGALYYNTSTNKLRVLQNAAWSDLGTGGTGGGWTDTGAVVQLVTPTDTIGSTGAGVTVSTHFIVSAGNVGIGTTNPVATLDVVKVSGGEPVLRLTNSGTSNPYLQFQSGGFIQDIGAGSVRIRGVGATSILTLDTNALERVRVDSAGNVGVGTTAPTSKLEVAGDIRTSGGGDLILNPAVSGATMYLYNDFGELNVTSGTASQMLFTVKSDGNVGIGTAGPGHRLQLGTHFNTLTANTSFFINAGGFDSWRGKIMISPDGNAQVGSVISSYHDNANSIQKLGLGTVGYSGVEQTMVLQNGNVGVGTTSPASKLHVLNGDIRVSTSAGQPSKGVIFQDGTIQTTAAGGNLSYSAEQTIALGLGTETWIKLATFSNRSYARIRVGIGSTNSEEEAEIEVITTYYTAQSAININRQTYNERLREVRVTGADGGSKTVYIKVRTSDFAPLIAWQIVESKGFISINNIEEVPAAGATLIVNGNATVSTNAGMNITGSVGIGTTAPDGKLDVRGDLHVGAGSNQARFKSDGTNTFVDAIPAASAIIFRNNGSVEKMRVDSVGNVGVGTTNPTERLQFADVASGSDIRIARKAAAAHAAGNVPSSLRLSINDGGEAGVFVMNQRNLANTFNDQYIRFDTHEGGASVGERVRIAPNGNVGIGTTSPGAKLDVAGHQLFSVAGASITFNAGGPTIGIPAGNTLAFGTSGIERMRLDNLGNLGVGVTAPGYKLDINAAGVPAAGNATALRLDQESDGGTSILFDNSIGSLARLTAAVTSAGSGTDDGVFTFETATDGTLSERMRINSAGNVGIGMANPVAKLDVNGSIRANAHVTHLPWTNFADSPPGYLKLVTPIIHNEGNMFSIRIFGFNYGAAYPIEIQCVGYAYSAGSLTNTRCRTEGTDLPVEIGTELRAGNTVVVIRIGTPTTDLYYPQLSAEYVGWNPKDPAGFVWVAGETTPAQVGNTNNVVIEDQSGASYFNAGNVGVGVTAPGARLEVSGQAGTPARNMILSNSSAEDATTRFIDFIRSGVDSEFIVYNNGDVRADGTFTGPADYAELFFSDDATLKPGELVCLADAAKVKRCGDGSVLIGVVSTKPGVLGVYADDITVAAEERDADPHWVKVGLMGQIPTKFSSKNGGVKSGDQLAVGAAGAAVKGDSPRTLLLIALEDAASDGTVRALVK